MEYGKKRGPTGAGTRKELRSEAANWRADRQGLR